MTENNQKGHGFFRKSKAYGLVCGVTLTMGALALSNAVSADEALADVTGATNLAVAPVPSPSNTDLANQADTQTGNITTPITSSSLDEAVATATDTGVGLNTTGTVTYDNLNQATADLEKQEATVEKATETQVAVDTALNQAKAEAEATGVQVTETPKQVYTDTKQALAEADKQVTQLSQASQMQKEADRTLADLTAQAKANGLTVTTEGTKTYNSLTEASSDLEHQVEAFNQAKEAKAQAEAQNQANQTAAKAAEDKANQALLEAIKKAQQAGTSVTQSGTVTLSKEEVDTVLQDYLKQINDTIAKNQEAQTQADKKNAELDAEYQKKLAENAKIEAENERIHQANEQEKARVDALNAKAQADYQEALAKYQKDKEAFDKELAKYNNTSVVNTNDNVSLKLVGQTNEGTTGIGYYKDLTVLYTGNQSVSAVDQLGYKVGTTSLSDTNGVNISNYSDGTPSGTTITSSVKGVYVVDGVDVGDSFKMMNLGKTTDGKTINALVTITKVEKNNTNPSYFTLGYEDEGVEYNALAFDYFNFAQIGLRFDYLDANGNPLELVNAFVIGDVDYIQSSAVNFGYDGVATFVPQKAQLKETIYGLTADGAWASDSLKSAPLGTYLAYGVSKSLEYTHVSSLGDDGRPSTNQDGAFIEFLLFGSSAKVNTITPPTPPEKPIPKKYEVNPEKPMPTTPAELSHVTPTFESVSVPRFVVDYDTVPVPSTLSLHAVGLKANIQPIQLATTTHPVEVKLAPQNEKGVTNTENRDLDGATVAKGSEVVWTLADESLKAGRAYTTSYVRRDPLPADFALDLEKTAQANPDWNLAFDTSTNTLTLTAKASLLNRFNADVTHYVDIPESRLYGLVPNDSTHYQNVFETIITTAETLIRDEAGNVIPNGKTSTYRVVSNVPFVSTPEEAQPQKDNKNGDNVIINGTPLPLGAKTHYDLVWDLDQYKGMVATKETIQKGFYFIDDYPEEALDLVDEPSSVTGVSYHHYDSLESAPQELREVLAKANITPTGAFQVWQADDAEDFFNHYVQRGKSIRITNPMLVKETLRGKDTEYQNKAYQIDFGNRYDTEIITNTVPKVDPIKENFNEDMVNINGKEVLAGSTNLYRLTWDLDQYKGIKADKASIQKGFFYVDDYPEEALDVMPNHIRYVTLDEDGKEIPVEGISVKTYDSLDSAPQAIKDALKTFGYTPKGAFQVFTADSPQAFYDAYVAKGQTLYIYNPMTVKATMAKTGGRYENTAIQIDFGLAQGASHTVNNVPKFEAVKEVLLDDKDVDGGTIKLGDHFTYALTGAYIPANRSDKLWQYDFKDDYAESHDKYDGHYKVTALTDFSVTFYDKDGQILDVLAIKKGDDITKYTTQIHDEKTGLITISFDKAFLDGLSNDEAFQAKAQVMMERIKAGEVHNTFSNLVNGVEVISNEVVTTTPEPLVPEVPQADTPVVQASTLPTTGQSSSLLALILGSLLTLLGLAGTRKSRKE